MIRSLSIPAMFPFLQPSTGVKNWSPQKDMSFLPASTLLEEDTLLATGKMSHGGCANLLCLGIPQSPANRDPIAVPQGPIAEQR